MRFTIAILVLLLAVAVGFGQKKQQAKITKEQATKTALGQVKGGTIQSSELEKEEGKLVWSFDIKAGKEIREIWIDANTGAYLKTETESAASEKEERVSEKAEKSALKRVPGEVVNKEAKKEKGKLVYSFEIKTKDGKTVEVDVDSKSNKVLKVETEEEEKNESEDEDDKD